MDQLIVQVILEDPQPLGRAAKSGRASQPSCSQDRLELLQLHQGKDELVQHVSSGQKGRWLFLFPFVRSTTCLEFPGIVQLLNQDVAPQKVVFCPSQIKLPKAWFSPAQQAQSFRMLEKTLEMVVKGKEIINGILWIDADQHVCGVREPCAGFCPGCTQTSFISTVG